MDAYEVWTDRLTAGLRALGLAFMAVVLGWILVALGSTILAEVGKGVAAALLIGYAGGRLHQAWTTRQPRLRTFRSDEPPRVSRNVPVPPAEEQASSLDTGNPGARAALQREICTAREDELKRAAELTARQLQQAIEIAEVKLGRERAQSDGALVAAVLDVLATNYRLATR